MSQTYHVTVPSGVGPGDHFQAQLGEQIVAVQVPPGAQAGSVLQVQAPGPAPPPVAQGLPIAPPQPMAPVYGGAPPQAPAYAQPTPAYAQPTPAYAQPTPAYSQPTAPVYQATLAEGAAYYAPPAQPEPYPTPPGYKAGGKTAKIPPPVHLHPTHSIQLPQKLQRLYLGLNWRSRMPNIDLDASAVLFNRSKLVHVVNFQSLRYRTSGDASVVHTGDVLTGQTQGATMDLERIYLEYVLPRTEEGEGVVGRGKGAQ